jgi:hypothetical protein
MGLPDATDAQVGQWMTHNLLKNGEPCSIGSREEYNKIRARISASTAHLGVSRKVYTHTAQEHRERTTQQQSVSETAIGYVQDDVKMLISDVATYAYWTCRCRHQKKEEGGTNAVGAFK